MNNGIGFGNIGYQDMDFFNEMLMQNNMNMPNPINNKNMNQNISYNNQYNTNLMGAYDGYIKGNLFKNLYDQYKDYKPSKLVPNNEQAELLLNVNQTTFAAHDIRLYLDNNPDDKNMIRMFNEYQKKASDAIKEYERKFGPILADSPSQNNNFSWQAYSFPWEMEEM